MRRQKQKYWSPCASYRVPRNQPSKEKSEAKNGFNFGYTFWGQFKYRQEGREAKTEAKNGFEKASPIPAATWNMKIPRNSQMASLHISCNRLPLPAPTKPTGHKDLRLQGTHWGGP